MNGQVNPDGDDKIKLKFALAVTDVILIFMLIVFGTLWYQVKRDLDARNAQIQELQQQLTQLLEEQQQAEKEKNQQIDTSTWKTYRNEEYGFELKLPSNFIVEEPYTSVEKSESGEFIILNYRIYSDSGDVKGRAISNFLMIINPRSAITPEQFAGSMKSSIMIVELGGKQFQKVGPVFYFLKGSESYFHFHFQGEDAFPELKRHRDFINLTEQEAILRIILSTFKFIE